MINKMSMATKNKLSRRAIRAGDHMARILLKKLIRIFAPGKLKTASAASVNQLWSGSAERVNRERMNGGRGWPRGVIMTTMFLVKQ